LLGRAPAINFIGNVEGRDIMTDAVDVVVTDGFTGNVVLKTLEGGMKAVVAALLAAFASEDHYKPHADALMPALLPLYETLDPETYGGADPARRRRGVHHLPRLVERAGHPQRHPGRREMVAAGMVDEIRAAIASGN
jgi:hypothetical protein